MIKSVGVIERVMGRGVTKGDGRMHEEGRRVRERKR